MEETHSVLEILFSAFEKHAAPGVETDFFGSLGVDVPKTGGRKHPENFLFIVSFLGQSEITPFPSLILWGE